MCKYVTDSLTLAYIYCPFFESETFWKKKFRWVLCSYVGELNLTAFQSAYCTSFGETKMLILHSQGGEYISDQLCVRAPSTPEHDREDEHARQRAAALQMTSPTHR